jgi:hypothetical protein
MHLPSLLLTVVLIVVNSSGSPLIRRQTTELEENTPWEISNIILYTSLPTSTNNSTITFHVADTNTGLESSTTCTISSGPGTVPDTGDNWTECVDPDFCFQYAGGKIGIQRWWNATK